MNSRSFAYPKERDSDTFDIKSRAMNFLDILIAIPLIYFIYKGWKRGLIFELAMLVGVVAGSWCAIHLSKGVADLLKLEGDTAILIAFFITFVGVLVIVFFLAKAVEGFVKLVKVGKMNNLLGAALGMLKCLCVLSILLNFITLTDPEGTLISKETQEKSALFSPTYKVGSRITSDLKTYVSERRAK